MSLPTSQPRRLLLVTASIGAGHNSVTRALRQELEGHPDLQLDTLDVMDHMPRWFRAYYAGGFFLGMSHLPRAFGLGYRLTNRPQAPDRNLLEQLRLRWESWAGRRLLGEVLRRQPELVVHMHFLSPPILQRAIRQGRLQTRQAIVATDVELHRLWYCQDIEHWFVPQGHTARRLEAWGVERQRITVSGIPIHRKWDQPLDRAAILRDWNLPDGRPIVLLAGGADYTVGPIVRIARRLAKRQPRAYVVVLSGRNKKLQAQLAGLKEALAAILPIPFTDRVNELVQVASLMVTKPGGVTTAECLAKGTPMVLSNPVSGHEGGNAAFLERQGAAVIARGTRRILAAACGLLSDPPALARMAQRARELYRPGRQIVAAGICRMLGAPPPPGSPACPSDSNWQTT
jgi:processive 1,2-diacylglycerol beta-glucosyltransferase